MLCECCREKIIKNRTIFHLFAVETHHICELCYQKNQLIPTMKVLPIEEYEMIWYNILKEGTLTPIAYMSFLKSFYKLFLTQYNDYLFLYFDYLSEDYFHILDTLKLGNLFLLTLYENIEKKENNYEI